MHNLKEIRKDFDTFKKAIEKISVDLDFDRLKDLDEKNTREILDSLIKDKPLKPGSFRGRKNTSPEVKKDTLGEKHA